MIKQLSLFSFIFIPLVCNARCEPETVVFTHGSTWAFLGVMSNVYTSFAQHIVHQGADDWCLHEDVSELAGCGSEEFAGLRQERILHESQALQDEGLVPILVARAQRNEGAWAAPHIAVAYEAVARESSTTKRDFATYGWRGVLDRDWRKKEAEKCYQQMCKLAHSGYRSRTVTIVAHSHGGTVARAMIDEEHKHNKGLMFQLITFGTPLCKEETLSNLDPRVLKRWYNIYTDGDRVVPDWHSMAAPVVSPRVGEALGEQEHIFDIRILMNGDTQAFGHLNMWCMNLKPIHKLGPLPLVVLTPAIIALVETAGEHDVDVNFCDADDQFVIEVRKRGCDELLATSENMHDLVVALGSVAQETWKPEYLNSNILFDYIAVLYRHVLLHNAKHLENFFYKVINLFGSDY